MINSKALKINRSGEVLFFIFPKIEAAGGCRHAFSSRLGGVSKGNCSSMSFGFSLGDDENNVKENYRIFCKASGLDFSKLVLSQQTHTNNLRIVTEDDIGKGVWQKLDYSDIDGLITAKKGLVLVTQYADCTPLAFYDPIKKVVATSHAGWRGTVAEIAAKTVEMMVSQFGSDPRDIIVGIGPHISKCCYEVDAPVINEIDRLPYLDKEKCYTKKGEDKYMLDLGEVNRQILINSGVLEENIDVSDLCTCCNSNIFHSHRATKGKRGTLALMICLE